jgi:16S rRNA processing protein RimM
LTLVEIGRVTRPHGVRGEIRVHLHWAGSETLDQAGTITLVRRGEPSVHRVRSARRADKAVLLSLEGVSDRDAAEALRGATVCVPRESLPAVEEGEYYLCDLVGARVVAPDAVLVGEVVEVRVHPTVDTLVIRTPDGKVVEQAISEPWIRNVDTEHKLVELSSTEGLI